jgi:hypothetical protein
MVGGKIPPMIIYDADNDIMKINPKTIEKNECEFGKLIAASPSCKIFMDEINERYNSILDSDFSDDVYKKMAIFELAIRMYLTNHNIGNLDDSLNVCINNLLFITYVDLTKLHNGRKFLNKIKHNNDPNDISWKSDIGLFNESYTILQSYNIMIL